ncbi:MAG: hypothetical protein EP346_00505 [Bacteroidetes bacterium]|nr:MAG: hypothetical protein EP346_00505 [Bacteroidota bacterium]
MRKLALYVLITLGLTAQAQRHNGSNELGLFIGGTNFIGDVGNYGIHIPKGGVIGVNYRHQFDMHYSIRGMFNFGSIANEDASSTMEARQFRNLSFKSNLYEGGIIGEVNFLEYRPGSRKYSHTPYIFAGFALTWFNPRAEYEGEWYDLHPLGTEGQRTSANPSNYYPLATWSIPFGMGYRWNVGDSWSMAIECGFRRTFTDYMDDVSGTYVNPDIIRAEHGDIAAALSNRTDRPYELIDYARGNDQTDDWYVFTGVHLYFELTPFVEKCANFLTR